MTMKGLDHQLKLMTLVMDIARGNVPIYYKATDINIQILAVAGVIVIVVYTVIVI